MILIDTREQWKDQIQQKLQSLHTSAHIMKLDHYTDYLLTSDNEAVEQIVAIQRKTINEVLSKDPSKEGYKSMMDEINDRIVNETKAKYGNAWLLVEEDDLFINKDGLIMSKRGKLLYETGINAKSYYNFLHSILKKGVNVKTTRNWEYSVWWLYSLHGYIQREHYPKPAKKYIEREEVIGALMGIEGIGEKKAQQIYALSGEKLTSIKKLENIINEVNNMNELTEEQMDAMAKEIKEE